MSPAAYYLDTSALVKRYVAEVGSEWVRALADPTNDNLLLTSRLTIAEIRSALARRRRETPISDDDHMLLLSALASQTLTQYHLVELEAPVIELTGTLLDRHILRAYDAVQLASALIINQALVVAGLPPLIFVAADDRLLTAAQAEGLPTENPNLHL